MRNVMHEMVNDHEGSIIWKNEERGKVIKSIVSFVYGLRPGEGEMKVHPVIPRKGDRKKRSIAPKLKVHHLTTYPVRTELASSLPLTVSVPQPSAPSLFDSAVYQLVVWFDHPAYRTI